MVRTLQNPAPPFPIRYGLTHENHNLHSLTPPSTIVEAYHRFLDDPSLSGEAIECSVDKCMLVPRENWETNFLNGYKSKRAVTVWDPLFKMMHFEGSGLPDAIP